MLDIIAKDCPHKDTEHRTDEPEVVDDINDKIAELTGPALDGVAGEERHVPPVPIVVEILGRW